MPCDLCKKTLADEAWHIKITKYSETVQSEGGSTVCEECIESFVQWRDSRDAKLIELKARRRGAA